MTLSGMSWNWALRVVGASVVSSAVIALWGNGTLAQIKSDATLGPERSAITNDVLIRGLPSDQISGGDRRGANLFHSFQQFNINEGRGAYFTNPAGVKNILSRVTGKDRSDILGTLGILGKANLFLINPKGIIFGPNATLDLKGSFLASTASSLKFADGTSFNAAAPQTLPLLTVSVPAGLQFGKNPARIQVQGNGQGIRTTSELIDTTVGLWVQPNQTLALVGGDMALEGATLKTAGGRIELGSEAGPGLVSLTPIDKGWALGYDDIQIFGDIQLSQQAVVDASGAGGGDIQVQGRQLRLQNGSRIEASTLRAEQGGKMSVTTSKSVEAIGTSANGEFASGLFADVKEGATGNGGNLTLETEQLILRDGAAISAATFGEGLGGTLAVKARESVELIGESADGQFGSYLFTSVEEGATGDGGNLTLETGQLVIRDGAVVDASTFGEGDAGSLTVKAHESVEVIGRRADGQLGSGLFTSVEEGATGDGGNLTLETGQLVIRDGAQIGAGTLGEGDAGSLTIKAHESVEVIGKSALDSRFRSGLFTSVQPGATGDGGNLTLETEQLVIRDGAQIGAGTLGEGASGDLIVNAAKSVEVIAAGLFTNVNPGGTGDGGNLTIETGQLILRDGAQVFAGTFGAGSAGKLVVNARKSVEVIGTTADGQFASGLFTSVQPGATGDGGNLTLETEQLILRDGAQIGAGTLGEGDAGSLTIKAHESVEVIGTTADGFPSGLTTQTRSSGSAGNLRIKAERLTVQDGAVVTVGSQGTGKAGNLQVQARSSRLDNQGKLIAESASGQGGNITLQNEDLLLLRRNSTISATAGTTGVGGDGGNITIDTDLLVALEDSDITANAFEGRGGNIEIETQGIFGIKERRAISGNRTSDIDASSEFGIEGNVSINTPDVDPSQELSNLPTEPVNLVIAQECQAGSGPGTSQFISSGKGGVPTNPYEPLDSRDILAEVQLPTQWVGEADIGGIQSFEDRGARRQGDKGTLPRQQMPLHRVSASAQATPPNRIVEAQGWRINEVGGVVLMAQAPAVTSHSSGVGPASCQRP